jgi:putative transposase
MWLVISSRQKAPKHGPGYLLVDGLDAEVVRKAEFAFNPGRRQEERLLVLLGVCCEVYNAGLEERRAAYRHPSQTKVKLFDQFNQLTGLDEERPEVFAFGLQPLRGTLRRLDEAYGAFLRRSANGETPGFPRFRSRNRFDTVLWAEPTSWKVDLGPGTDRNGATLYINGVGTMQLPRGAKRQLGRFADRGGVPKTLTVTRKRAGNGWVWRATVCFTGVDAEKTHPDDGVDQLVGVDRGTIVTAATSDGLLLSMPPVWLAVRDEITELQRQRASKKKYSRQWRTLNKRIARLYSKASKVADNWARETARQLVDGREVVVLEDLKLANMTRSAKGTVDEPGTNVAAKAALNRKMSDAALGRLRHRICTRAEEAGCRVWAVPAAYTSQRCAACGHVDSENRPTRDRFSCTSCGHTDHADTNAAVNIAALGADAEAAWRAAGSPSLVRPKPRLQRRREPEVPLAA